MATFINFLSNISAIHNTGGIMYYFMYMIVHVHDIVHVAGLDKNFIWW